MAITKRRAAFIARDQNNKSTATITRVRQQGLGIKQAKWRHSRGGKHPRKSHQEADGKAYDVDKGSRRSERCPIPPTLPATVGFLLTMPED